MKLDKLINERESLENKLKQLNSDIEREMLNTKKKSYNVNFILGVNCNMTVFAYTKDQAKEIINEFAEDVQFSGELHDADFDDVVEDGYYEKCEEDKPQYIFVE